MIVIKKRHFINCLAMVLLLAGFVQAQAGPVVFWQPDSTAPGNVVLLAGGGLAKAQTARVWRLDDAQAMPDGAGREPATPAYTKAQPILQASEQSVKFIMPPDFQPGVFAAQVNGGGEQTKAAVLNRPEIWFLQPVKLQPGLHESQAAPGAQVQIIGKDFLLPGDKGTPRVALRKEGGGAWIEIPVSSPERFSLLGQLPSSFAEGHYELWVSNGFGGAVGWGGPLAVEITKAERWPDKVFDVKKDFGARGDDVTDDTGAIQRALAEARRNGGGIVYFPWGIYRLSQTLVIPPRTMLRGESRDASVLMWPVDEPKALTDFTQAAVFGQAPYAMEDLSLIARKVNFLVQDTSFPQGLPPELKPRPGQAPARDVFLRRLNLQHWLMAGHPDHNALLWNTDPKTASKYNGDGASTLGISGVTNFELSDCQSQGGQLRIRDIHNARETGNLFGNEMGYCWAEMGGGAHYVVSQGNEIRASSSWGFGTTAMKYLYSAHNKSYNFVRGEREAMTLDISSLPTFGPAPHNLAWFGRPAKIEGLSLTLTGIKAQPGQFVGMTVTILNGPGKGQFREITANTPTVFTVDRPWDVMPDETSTIGVWALMRHMIVYKCEGYDCSAFAQLWGNFYDYIIDSCHTERNQGIWGQSGWFIQFRSNDCWYANTYHPGIGPGGGQNPEKTMPFSFVGMIGDSLRVTKFGSDQYGRKLVMVDDVAGEKVPTVFGAIIRGNSLKYNQRIACPPSFQARPQGGKDEARMFDLVVDGNTIEHSPVGIQIGPKARGVLLNDNHFLDVAEPYALSRPENVKK